MLAPGWGRSRSSSPPQLHYQAPPCVTLRVPQRGPLRVSLGLRRAPCSLSHQQQPQGSGGSCRSSRSLPLLLTSLRLCCSAQVPKVLLRSRPLPVGYTLKAPLVLAEILKSFVSVAETLQAMPLCAKTPKFPPFSSSTLGHCASAPGLRKAPHLCHRIPWNFCLFLDTILNV